MIPFQRTYKPERALNFIEDCLMQGNTAGDGPYTKACSRWLMDHLLAPSVLMTTSCTHALELAVQLLDLRPEDEVIVPSFTYPSTANAVLMAGARVVFTQVRASDLTMDPERLEEKITARTKAVIPVHYGGNVCQMDRILPIAKAHGLTVIEDGAQAFLSTYKGRYAGTFGDFGCFSFHGTKDLVAGEGGALLVNNRAYREAASVFRAKGTNREAFIRGDVDYYEWVAKGSSYSPSELTMALLFSQLEMAEEVLIKRRRLYDLYNRFFESHRYKSLRSYSCPSEAVNNNGHLYYIEFETDVMADRFGNFMKAKGVQAFSHFVPLHSSRQGKALKAAQQGFDVEEGIGKRLIRLPLYPDMTDEVIETVLNLTDQFMTEA